MRSIAIALPILLLLPAGAALAQSRGSYQRSCTDIRENGNMLSARCRAGNGQYNDTTINTDRCNGGPVANSNGRLACGSAMGTASPSRNGGDDDQGGRGGYRGGGYRNSDDGGGYGAPRPRRSYRPDDEDGYTPPPRRRPRYDPDQDY